MRLQIKGLRTLYSKMLDFTVAAFFTSHAVIATAYYKKFSLSLATITALFCLGLLLATAKELLRKIDHEEANVLCGWILAIVIVICGVYGLTSQSTCPRPDGISVISLEYSCRLRYASIV